MTREDLQQISELLDAKLDAKLAPLYSRLDNIDESLEEIREDAAVTRSAVNSLVEWADNVAIITGQRFPVKKSAKAAE